MVVFSFYNVGKFAVREIQMTGRRGVTRGATGRGRGRGRKTGGGKGRGSALIPAMGNMSGLCKHFKM